MIHAAGTGGQRGTRNTPSLLDVGRQRSHGFGVARFDRGLERLELDTQQSRLFLQLVAVSGDGAGADRFVTALADLATVVVEAATGPLTTAFSVREFPAFYVVDDEWTITAAANTIDDLATVPA